MGGVHLKGLILGGLVLGDFGSPRIEEKIWVFFDLQPVDRN
jgi:hypothetical protein